MVKQATAEKLASTKGSWAASPWTTFSVGPNSPRRKATVVRIVFQGDQVGHLVEECSGAGPVSGSQFQNPSAQDRVVERLRKHLAAT